MFFINLICIYIIFLHNKINGIFMITGAPPVDADGKAVSVQYIISTLFINYTFIQIYKSNIVK